jgi:hypothetical protein
VLLKGKPTVTLLLSLLPWGSLQDSEKNLGQKVSCINLSLQIKSKWLPQQGIVYIEPKMKMNKKDFGIFLSAFNFICYDIHEQKEIY